MLSLIDVNAQRPKDGACALSLALKSGLWPIVRLLLQHPTINVGLQASDGSTPLMEAVKLTGCMSELAPETAILFNALVAKADLFQFVTCNAKNDNAMDIASAMESAESYSYAGNTLRVAFEHFTRYSRGLRKTFNQAIRQLFTPICTVTNLADASTLGPRTAPRCDFPNELIEIVEDYLMLTHGEDAFDDCAS